MRQDRRVLSSSCVCCLCRGLICMVLGLAVGVQQGGASESRGDGHDFAGFKEAMDSSDDAKALAQGEEIFVRLQQKYKADASFRAYEARLKAAQFLADRMQQELKKAAGTQLSAVVGEVFGKPSEKVAPRPLSVAPAKRFYETSVKLFSRPVSTGKLTAEEKSFLARYYDLKLRRLTSAIAQAGQAVAIAEPSFKGTYDYTLVLPMLHASKSRPVNTSILPQWMQHPDQLRILSDSCLLHFESPFQAMKMAEKSAERLGKEFSGFKFYRSAARRCGQSRPHVAVECLNKAIDLIPEDDPNTTVMLHFDIIQFWMDSRNYPLAVGEARKTFETYPDHEESGKAIWLYYYALSKSDNSNQILTTIDTALQDQRCSSYHAGLLYIKWWALKGQPDQTARVAAVEHELLKRYGNNPIVATIMLSRATDLLASQAYGEAYEVLSQLAEKFPATDAGAQAKKMMAKLGAFRKAM